MKPRHQVSRAALELIKGFEGFRARAARLPDGRWTIGYGHTRTAREGAEVSAADAEFLLIYDLMEAEAAIRELVFTPLDGNQFDALNAFVFNIGVDNFKGSAVLRRLNEGEHLKAAYAMELWRKAEVDGEIILLDALVRRRAAEKTLFLTPENGFVPAPTALVRPRLDEAGRDQAPEDAVVELVPSLTGDKAVLHAPEPPLVPLPVEDRDPELDLEPLVETEPQTAETQAAETETAPQTLDAELDEEPAPSAIAESAAAQPVAYDGEPLLAPSVDDEAPLPPEDDETPLTLQDEAQEHAAAETVADEPAGEAETAPSIPASAAAATRRSNRNVTLWSSALGVLGLILTVIGVVSVYKGRYFHNGATGPGLVLGIAGIFCVAAAVYFLLDRIGAREAD